MDKTIERILKGILLIGILFAIFILVEVLTLTEDRKYTNKDFNIKTYHSKIDKDEDGIDDQTDILQNTRKYISTRPKYKSKYYDTGYPNDQYGVCTDVVAFGLKGAGYDLMYLVNKDIIENKELYNIDKPDKNIDFRRVRNLKIWFKRNAISLTTDIKDYKEWQGGDIVIFEKHIGIVSDKRNKDKVPYLIHLANPYQRKYEEDILSTNYKIIGHYRMS